MAGAQMPLKSRLEMMVGKPGPRAGRGKGRVSEHRQGGRQEGQNLSTSLPPR